MTHSIPEGNSVTRIGKICLCEKLATCFVSGSQETQKRQISHYCYAWGQPKSVTSDDLWKVNIQCQRSYVVMRWPKSCIMSPFQPMAASPVAENTVSWKVGRRPYLLWRHSSVTWPDLANFIFPNVAQMVPHKLCKISARSALRFSGHFRKAHGGCITPPHLCTPHGRG